MTSARHLTALLTAAAIMACDDAPAPVTDAEPTCRRTIGPAVEWARADGAQGSRLDAWCAQVGPAVVLTPDSAAAARPMADTLWIVSWNAAVGGGDLTALVADLRAGRLTGGRPPEHFVLLLQEAHRSGPRLPPHDPGLPGGSPKDNAPPDGPRRDIVAAAERLGLWLVYVPSMRNGESEDRGNAILSSLPLEDPLAVELPVARQRRVAVGAYVAGRTHSDRPWRVQALTVHLESSPAGEGSDEAQRLAQTRSLLLRLPYADAAVAAGDFNTKAGGVAEPLVSVMMDAYPDTPALPDGSTYRRFFGLWREYLDYAFFRLPDGARAWYRLAPDRYGSDHHPLVGAIAF